MGKPWLSLSEQQLDELSLDEEASSEGHQQPSSRPQCLSGPAHEVLLVLVAAFTGASFLLLQRATMVLTDTIRHSLQLDLSDMSWMSASSGYVPCTVWRSGTIYDPTLTLLSVQSDRRHLPTPYCQHSRPLPNHFAQSHSDIRHHALLC